MTVDSLASGGVDPAAAAFALRLAGTAGGTSGAACAYHLAQLAARLTARLPPAEIIQLPAASGGGYLVVRRSSRQQSSSARRQRRAAASPLCPSATAGLPAVPQAPQQPAALPPGWDSQQERRYQSQLAVLRHLAARLPQRLAMAAAARGSSPACKAAERSTGSSRPIPVPQQSTAASHAARPQPVASGGSLLGPGSPSPSDAWPGRSVGSAARMLLLLRQDPEAGP